MSKTIYPSKNNGSIRCISSKSESHRALICAALSPSKSILYNIDLSDDINQSINALKTLGANIKIFDNKIEVVGFDLFDKVDEVNFFVNESGSTLRFLIPLASIKSHRSIIFASPKLISRPQIVYQEIFNQKNLKFEINKDNIIVEGSLDSDMYEVVGNISSQFISGLLFVLPLLKKDSRIKIINNLQSKSYVDLTIKVMADFNVFIKEENNTYYISANQKYKNKEYYIENDFSQLAFFAVLASINNDLEISNVNLDSIQGDKAILNFLEMANVKIDYYDNKIKVYKSKIKTATFDLADTPDLGPILCVLGLFSDDHIKLINTKRLKYKESDRLLVMKKELEKFGAKIILEENSATIYRLENFKKVDSVYCHNDHRIAMALSVFATTLNHPLKIEGSSAINKSYPNFYKDLEEINVMIK